MLSNVRLPRLIIIVFISLILIVGGGAVFLWYIGGQTLNQKQPTLQTVATKTVPNTSDTDAPTYQPPLAFKLQDISTTMNNNKTALIDYSRAVGAIMSIYNDKAIENELTLVVKAAETGDQTTVKKISMASTRYSESALRLKQLVVPPTVAQVHLNLINSLISLAESSYLMAQIEKEPVTALETAQVYPTRLKNFFTAINNLNFFLLANNIVLPEKERATISLGL